MKQSMSTVIFILIAAGIIFLALFHKPVKHTETDLQKWFSSRLEQIEKNLEADIDKDKKGEYPHDGIQSFEKRGMITYVLPDKNHSRFDISDKNALARQDIVETAGYRKLQKKVQQLDLQIHLEEHQVDGDGVESFIAVDEYISDFPRYYTVTISGW
jgi:hypothetical protein